MRLNPAMPRLALALSAILICTLLAGCGASGQPKPALESDRPDLVLWPRAEKAVRLRFKADRDLNMYDSKGHSIQICVYQLDKPEAFLNLAKTQEGITTLLEAGQFDKSVKNAVRLFMQPLEETVFELDRAENATFVGVVCGYFDSTPENSAKTWEIKPLMTTTGHLFWKSTTYSAGTLDLALRLTSHALAEDGGAKAGIATKTGGRQ
ncbi:MAG: type VI secretion system lipoprotein TssJ [Desulfovibrio sp.]|nr:type VI secretion system lipoprotein TssJ [Desulfovibrio sp.]